MTLQLLSAFLFFVDTFTQLSFFQSSLECFVDHADHMLTLLALPAAGALVL